MGIFQSILLLLLAASISSQIFYRIAILKHQQITKTLEDAHDKVII